MTGDSQTSTQLAAATDFGLHSHEELLRMLKSGNPNTVAAVGDAWQQLGRGLHDRGNDIERQLRNFAPHWSGGSAKQFSTMMTDLVAGIREVAATALAYRDLVQQSGDALRDAQAKMPGAVTISPVDPTVAALAAGTLPAPTATALLESASPASRAAIIQQVQTTQQQTSDATNAHNQAVQIMTQLATHYVTNQQLMPPLPVAAERPTTVPGVTPATSAGSVTTGGTSTTTTTSTGSATTTPNTDADGAPKSTPPTPALFSHVYISGAAAAGAAVASLFGGSAGKLLGKQKTKDKAAKDTSGIGGGIGGGGIGSSFDEKAAAPVGNPDLAGTGSTATAGIAAAAATAGGVAASTRSMGAMPMSMMPMGMGGEGGAGTGGRRHPPWLQETEEVWGGDSVDVTKSVIG